MRTSKNIMSQCLSLTTLGLLCASNASAATYYFDGAGITDLQDYETLANWNDQADGLGATPTELPGATDDVELVLGARFKLNNLAADYTIASLTQNTGSGSYLSKGKLTVTGDVNVPVGFNVQGNGTFVWGGTMTLGDGAGTDALELTFGTHTDPSKVVGNNLNVSTSGQLRLRWFTPATEGSAVPDIDLSGALSFDGSSSLKVTLEGGSSAGFAQTEGSYFLVGSQTITGTLPSLDLSNGWTAEQAANSFLSIDSTNADVNLQGIYLNVSSTAIPEPSSAALIGIGGFALIMRRRR